MATAGAGDGTTAPETAETTEAATPGDAPWSADLAERFEDETVRSQVDAYLREKVQPHTTQLEQNLAQLRDAVPEGLQRFWADLGEDPDAALTALASQVYDDNPEAEEIFKVAIKYAAGNPDASEEEVIEAATEHVQQGGTSDEFEVELDPEDRERLNYVDQKMAEDEDKEYRASLNELKEAHPDHFVTAEGQPMTEEQLVDVLSPLVVAAPEEMDDDEALAYAFERYQKTYTLIHGGGPGSEAAAAEAVAGLTDAQIDSINAASGAPPIVTGGQNASVPAQKQYDSIADAVRDFGAEMAAKKAAPPVV